MDVECPECKNILKCPDEYAGKNIKCKKCNFAFCAPSKLEANDPQPAKSAHIAEKKDLQNAHTIETHAVNCGNCDTRIGKLEKKYKWKDYLVCENCFLKLRPSIGSVGNKFVQKKPTLFIAIGGMRLGAGICNIIAGAAFYWLIFPVVMIPFGIIEIITACNLMKDKPEYPKNIKTFAILEIVAIITLAGWISVIVGVLTLVFLSDDKVVSYLDYLNESEQNQS